MNNPITSLSLSFLNCTRRVLEGFWGSPTQSGSRTPWLKPSRAMARTDPNAGGGGGSFSCNPWAQRDAMLLQTWNHSKRETPGHQVPGAPNSHQHGFLCRDHPFASSKTTTKLAIKHSQCEVGLELRRICPEQADPYANLLPAVTSHHLHHGLQWGTWPSSTWPLHLSMANPPTLLLIFLFFLFQAGTGVIFMTISIWAEYRSTPLCCKWNRNPNHSRQVFLFTSPAPCSPLSQELLAHCQAPLYLERTLLLPTLIWPILGVLAWGSNPSQAMPQSPREESTCLVFPISAVILG